MAYEVHIVPCPGLAAVQHLDQKRCHRKPYSHPHLLALLSHWDIRVGLYCQVFQQAIKH